MPDRSEQLRLRLLATFKLEAEEHLRVLDSELAEVARAPTQDGVHARLETMFRVVHTLKGAARSVALTEIGALCQSCETLLRKLVGGETSLDAETIAFLQDSSDALAAMVETAFRRVENTQGAAPAVPAKTEEAASDAAAARSVPEPLPRAVAGHAETPLPGAMGGESSIRVRLDHLDRMSLMVEDLLLPKLTAAERARQAHQLADSIRQLRSTLPRRGRLAGDATDTSELAGALRSLEAQAKNLSLAMRADEQTLRFSIDGLAEELRRTRMMPAGIILDAFPRMVRELARDTGKEVSWQVSGADLQIDRKVLELVKDPLIHLVRNAIDHGIETPAQRTAAGKPRRGNLSVSFRLSEGGRVVVEVSDDGAGFAIGAIRDAALRSRAVTAEQAVALSDQEILELAFRAGVSTSPVVTEISGHGRGLPIARERIERIEGRFDVISNPGRGTTVRLTLPTSIATYRGLLVSAGGQRFLWPGESIDQVVGLLHPAAEAAATQGLVAHGEQSLPFGDLAAVLGLPRQPVQGEQRRLPCIIARTGDRRAMLLVDEVLGESEAVIKDLRPPLVRLRCIMAAGLLGTGEIVLVLRPSDVLASIRTRPVDVLAQQVTHRSLRVLVVDDSITTRTMERNLLEAAGYTVRVAADGQEAWTILQGEDIDLVVSDVDMPIMDGFELTSKIRADSRLAQLPVILVTALEAREDKERGVRVGANAYVLKSAFDQSNLLEIVRRLT